MAAAASVLTTPVRPVHAPPRLAGAVSEEAPQSASASQPIVAVDRRPLVRAGLARLAGSALDCRVEAVADLAEAGAVLRATESDPRALLIGVPRGEDPGRMIGDAMRFGVPVVCAVDEESEAVVRSLLAAGAHGYVVTERTEAESLRATLSGIEAGEPLRPLIGGRLGDVRAGRAAPVTERSLEVLGSLADGLHDNEIATLLGISTSSVRKHIASAQSRLGARTRTQAVATAARAGLL
jgi:DNA-binding NarL/FixJ family response regulator